MSNSKLKQKIEAALQKGLFPGAAKYVDVSTGEMNQGIHVVVISREFDGLGWKKRNDIVWNVLQSKLKPEEWGEITLTVSASPEEVKAI